VKTDEELLTLCQKRDSHAWESLVRRHQGRVLTLAYQFTGDNQTAEDLAQDVFVRLYESIDMFEPGRKFQAWFTSLARNMCIDHYRKRRKDRQIVSKPVEEFYDLESTTEGSDARLERRELKQRLLAALDSLGTINRDAIVMKDLQGLSHEEMATMEGVPIGTIKSRVSRARAELARVLIRLERPQMEAQV